MLPSTYNHALLHSTTFDLREIVTFPNKCHKAIALPLIGSSTYILCRNIATHIFTYLISKYLWCASVAKLLSTFGISSVIFLLNAGIFRRAITSPSTCLVIAARRSKHRKASGYKLFTVSTRISCICHPGPRWVLRYCSVFLRVSLRAGAGSRHRTYFILSKGRVENAVSTYSL